MGILYTVLPLLTGGQLFTLVRVNKRDILRIKAILTNENHNFIPFFFGHGIVQEKFGTAFWCIDFHLISDGWAEADSSVFGFRNEK